MAVSAINLTMGASATPYTQGLVADLTTLRDVRERVLRRFAALDIMRDAGAVTAYMVAKLDAQGADAAAKIAEAQKLYDELNSLKGYIESEAANTLGAALLQICAKLGI